MPIFLMILGMIFLIITPSKASAETMSNSTSLTQLARCSGCGCKGGPGWRINKSGRCASYKNLAKACGNPPNPSRCTYELGASKSSNTKQTKPASFLVAPTTLTGRASVIDADTIEIHGQRVRIFGIDAPEGKQTCKDAIGKSYRCGQIGSIALDKFINSSQPIRCEHKDTDRYQRFVGQCFTAAGHDIADWLARKGHALDYRQYSNGAYAPAESEAMTKKEGIWQGSFIEPWEWRKGVR